MKRANLDDEYFSDVKNLREHSFLPGQTVPFDLALFYPGGFVP